MSDVRSFEYRRNHAEIALLSGLFIHKKRRLKRRPYQRGKFLRRHDPYQVNGSVIDYPLSPSHGLPKNYFSRKIGFNIDIWLLKHVIIYD
jgi:hypothetical protein